jgi:membrane protein involved in colicin uptake
MPDATTTATSEATPPAGADILDRLLGQPHTTSEPPEVTAQREALMTDVATEIRRLRQIIGERDAIAMLAKQVRTALEAYEAAEGKAAEKAAAESKAAEAKAAKEQQAAHAQSQAQHEQHGSDKHK